MHYATIKECDVANGPGVRVSVFVSGCNHHCKGCFNEVAWNFEYGEQFTQETIDKVLKDLDHDYIEGLSCYTGFDFEKDVIGKMYNTWSETKELISDIDVIVDGKFELEKKNPSLKFRGSENQRLIDVKKSMQENKIIWADIEDEIVAKAN